MTPEQMRKRASYTPAPNDVHHLWLELAEMKEYIENLILGHRDHYHDTHGPTGTPKGGPNAG